MTCNNIAVIGLVAASTLSVLIIGLAGGLVTSPTDPPLKTPAVNQQTVPAAVSRDTTTTASTTTTLTTTASTTTTSSTTTSTTTTSTTTTSTTTAPTTSSTVRNKCGCYAQDEEIPIENDKCVLDLDSFPDVAGSWIFKFELKINSFPTEPDWYAWITTGNGSLKVLDY